MFVLIENTSLDDDSIFWVMTANIQTTLSAVFCLIHYHKMTHLSNKASQINTDSNFDIAD